MSLWRLAASNLWRNRRRYLAYLGSAAFAVMVYFMYTALVYHPKVEGGAGLVQNAAQGIRAATVVIVVFTFLFLLYANSAFVRSRKQEFGLLSLLGVSRLQLAQMLIWENLGIALVALGIGLGLGLLFLRLFFLAISVLLRYAEPLAVVVTPDVWGQTLATFGGIFIVVALWSLRDVVRSNIIQLVRARRRPKEAPRFSRVKAILGLVLVLLGYAWAAAPDQGLVILGVVPVTTIVSVGTYLLMREGSVALLLWLHRREGFFYRPGPFLVVSQLLFKLQDNYRVLAAVSLLIATILSAMGTVVSFSAMVVQHTLERNPHAFQLVSVGPRHGDAAAAVEAALAERFPEGYTRQSFATRRGQLAEAQQEVTLVPYEFYAHARRAVGWEPLPPSEGGILVWPYRRTGEPPEPMGDTLLVGDEAHPVRYLSDYQGTLFNPTPGVEYVLVLPADVLAELVAAGGTGRVQVTTWSVPDWKGRTAEAVSAQMQSQLQAEQGHYWNAAVDVYQGTISAVGVNIFVGVFVSLVFFAATSSLLYFRLFTEVDGDRAYYRRLQELGVSKGQVRKVVRQQVLVIFFVPFVVGVTHAAFAMGALGTILGQSVPYHGALVAAGYLLLHLVYFAATYGAYWRSLGLERMAGVGGRAVQV